MSRWSLQVMTPVGSWVVDVPATRSLLLGRGRQAAIELDDPTVAERHATVTSREGGLVFEAVRGSQVLVNDVPVDGATVVRHGDEVGVGATRLVAMFVPTRAPQRPRLLGYDAAMAQLKAELARAARQRPVGLVGLAFPTLNVTARQALVRRVVDEVARQRIAASWAEFSADLLVGIVSELPVSELDSLCAHVPSVAGPRANVAFARAPADGDDADALVGALWSRLLGPDSGDDALPVIADPAMVRLFAFADALALRDGSVCAVGEPGSGRATWLRELAARARRPLVEARGRPTEPASLPSGTWQLVHDVDPEADFSPMRRLMVTSSVPLEGFETVVQLPPLVARPIEVPLMAEAFLAQARVALGRPRLHLGADALPLLSAWHWPGNVLELKNVMFRAARAAVRDEVGRDSLPQDMAEAVPVENLRGAMHSAERDLLLEALSRTRWNVTAAASRLGVPRRTVVYRMAKLGLKRPAR